MVLPAAEPLELLAIATRTTANEEWRGSDDTVRHTSEVGDEDMMEPLWRIERPVAQPDPRAAGGGTQTTKETERRGRGHAQCMGEPFPEPSTDRNHLLHNKLETSEADSVLVATTTELDTNQTPKVIS